MKKFFFLFIVAILCSSTLIGCAGETGAKGANGEKGEKGDTGNGISKIEKVDNEFIVTYTDGTVQSIAITECNEGTYGLDYYPLPDGTYAVSAGTTKFLEEILIPSSYNGNEISQILGGAFTGANNLKSINIPNSVHKIGASAFSACESLTHISIPDGVTSIGSDAFRGCNALESITLTKTLSNIGEYAFYGCDIKTVYYMGTKEEWAKIQIDSGNDNLLNATIVYDYKGN